jgi:hypothetical protein
MLDRTFNKLNVDLQRLLRYGLTNFMHRAIELHQIIDANVGTTGKPSGNIIMRDHEQCEPSHSPIGNRQL